MTKHSTHDVLQTHLPRWLPDIKHIQCNWPYQLLLPKVCLLWRRFLSSRFLIIFWSWSIWAVSFITSSSLRLLLAVTESKVCFKVSIMVLRHCRHSHPWAKGGSLVPLEGPEARLSQCQDCRSPRLPQRPQGMPLFRRPEGVRLSQQFACELIFCAFCAICVALPPQFVVMTRWGFYINPKRFNSLGEASS